jgi:phenylacetic acid degradation protein
LFQNAKGDSCLFYFVLIDNSARQKPFHNSKRKDRWNMPLYEFEGKRPKIGETSFVHPAAILIGGVTIGENCYIGPGAVLRGDFGYIVVGNGSNIQENCVVHTYTDHTATIGQNNHIGHGAKIHGVTLGYNVLIGMNAVLHEGVVIGDHSIIGSGCVVPADRAIPSGKLVLGIPAKVVGDVSEEQRKRKIFGTGLYQTLPKRYRETFKLIG